MRAPGGPDDMTDKLRGDKAGHISPVPRISIQAFCDSPDVSQVVNAAAADRRMDRAQIKVHMGGASAAVEAYRSAPTPNVIIIESNGDRDELLSFLEKLSEFCDPGTKVIVIGRLNDIILYRELMSRGISDYLVAPFSVMDLVRTVSHLYSSGGTTSIGRIIAVAGTKGGCGSSTVAHNLAWSISREMQLSTVIVDLDLAFGTAGLDFNQDPPQSIAEAVFAPDRLDSNLIDRLLSKCTDNLSLLAAPATLERPYDFAETAFDGVFDVLRSTVPCIVLDLPHQWSAWARRAMIGADEVVVVTAPDLANLRNAKNLVDILRTTRAHDHPPKLVMNGVGMVRRPEISVPEFVKAVELPPVATIPFDAKIFGMAANNGQMIGEVEAGAKIAEIFVDLARVVSGRAETRKPKRGILPPFVAKFAARKKAS